MTPRGVKRGKRAKRARKIAWKVAPNARWQAWAVIGRDQKLDLLLNSSRAVARARIKLKYADPSGYRVERVTITTGERK